MKRFAVTAQGRKDLIGIWRRIAKEASVDTANRVLSEIHDAIQMLVELPGMGHTRSDVSDARFRFWNVYHYVIAYRTDRTPLTIARVVHGSRDFTKVFK